MAKWPFVPQRQASGATYRPASLGFGCISVSKSGELSCGNAQNVPVPVMPSGALVPFAGAAAPAGWLLCSGGAVSRTQYAQLFAVIGTTYGSGDGKTTFNLPDLRGRVPVGVNGSADPLGKREGEKTHTLTAGETPSVKGTITSRTMGEANLLDGAGCFRYERAAGAKWVTSISPGVTADRNTDLLMFDNGGKGIAHNNMQPSLYLNYIIKA